MNYKTADHLQADRLDEMARSCRMASRPEILADQVRDEHNFGFWRGVINGLALAALLWTAIVAGCVEFAL